MVRGADAGSLRTKNQNTHRLVSNLPNFSEGTPVYKIAIAGASSLLGRELKEALEESPLAAASFLLLDEADEIGKLDQVGDEVTFVQPILAEHSSALTSLFLQAAMRSPVSTGAMRCEPVYGD